MNNTLVLDFMNGFITSHPNPKERVNKFERFGTAIKYLRDYQKDAGELNPEKAYAKLREAPVTRDNYKLRSDLSIFMQWYTIQLEHIDSTEESDERKEGKL